MMKCCFVLLFLLAGDALGSLDKRILASKPCGNERQYHVEIKSVQKGQSCGGALLNPRWLITASHCAEQKVKVKLGVNSVSTVKKAWSKVKSFFKGSENKLEQEITPEGKQFTYKDEEGRQHDIMLIKLNVDVSANLPVIKLPSADCAKPPLDATVHIGAMGAHKAGGKPGSDVRCATTKITACEENDKPDRKYHSDESTTMCAHSPAVEACFGDAGSAVEYDSLLHGIIVNNPVDKCEKTIVMLDICHYREWIQKTMKQN